MYANYGLLPSFVYWEAMLIPPLNLIVRVFGCKGNISWGKLIVITVADEGDDFVVDIVPPLLLLRFLHLLLSLLLLLLLLLC